MRSKRETIIERAKAKPKRIKATFTFDADLYEAFQNECDKEGTAFSRMLEILMQDFLKLPKD